MRNAKNWRRLLLPGLALAAAGFLFCKPGNALDPVQEPGSGSNPGKDTMPVVPVIGIDSLPAEIKTGDTGSVILSVTDSLRLTPMAGLTLKLSSAQLMILSATSDSVVTRITTDSAGQARFRVLGALSGAANIQAIASPSARYTRIRNLAITLTQVVQTPTITRKMVFIAAKSTLKADGADQTALNVVVKDDNYNPLVGERVVFTADGGLVTAGATTDSNGSATGYLTSERANKVVTVVASLPGRNLSAVQRVTLTGITLAISPDKSVLTADTARMDNILFELKDANNVPISGDTLQLSVANAYRGFEKSGQASIKAVTDGKGQYRSSVTCDREATVIVSGSALGDTASAAIAYTNNKMVVTAASPRRIVGDGKSTLNVSAKVWDKNGQPYSGVTLKWTTTFGSFTTTPITTTVGGASSITLLSAHGTGLAIINVEASVPDPNSLTGYDLVASANDTVWVTAQKVSRLQIKVTPDNIPVRVGEATLIAQAFDDEDNVMQGVLIGFRMIKGAGAGDETIDPPVDYTKSGKAQSTFHAGGVISQYQSVRLAAVALDVQGTDTLVVASSDTVGLTISGPPYRVSVGHDIQKGENPDDGTFHLPVSAVVVDVNGNLVADGTQVHFSCQPVATVIYEKGARVTYYPTTFFTIVDSIPVELPWTDYNDNGKLDPGEAASPYDPTHTHPSRGEDLDGNGIVNEGLAFEDINGNGKWDTMPEPFVVVSKYDTATKGNKDSVIYADLNGNGHLDMWEPLVGDTTVDKHLALSHRGELAGSYNSRGLIEVNHYSTNDKTPFPEDVAVGLTGEIDTQGGKAVNKIKYVQSMAWRVKVRVTAEANGIRSSDDFVLPVIVSGGK